MTLYFRYNNKQLASRLRHRISIEQPSEEEDGMGGTTRAWQEIAVVWGEISAITAREQLVAMQLQSQATHRVTLRYREGVTAAMRLVCKGKVFNIRAVTAGKEDGTILELLVEEGVVT